MHQEWMLDEPSGGSLPALGVISAWFGALVIGVTAVAHVTPAGQAALSLLDSLRMILFAFVLASLIYLAAQGRHGLGTAVLPLFINISTFIIISFVPFGALWQEAQFQWRWQSYNQVVDMVETGELQVDSTGALTLPWQYRHLSSGGEALVLQGAETTRIFFIHPAQHAAQLCRIPVQQRQQPSGYGRFWWALANLDPETAVLVHLRVRIAKAVFLTLFSFYPSAFQL